VIGQSRRAFAAGVAGLCAGLSLDACSSPAPASPYSGQLRTAALAAALENQAVSAYQAVDAALRAGKFGPAIPALAAFVRTATAHHVQHAATWNAILRNAHKPTITGTPLSGSAQVMSTIGAASNVDAVVSALQRLEIQAAQTYTAAIESLTGTGSAVTAAAAIAPVEAMHAAAIGYAFNGQSAVIEFLGTGGAVSIKELTA
jgi:Ferritin-like domain